MITLFILYLIVSAVAIAKSHYNGIPMVALGMILAIFIMPLTLYYEIDYKLLSMIDQFIDSDRIDNAIAFVKESQKVKS